MARSKAKFQEQSSIFKEELTTNDRQYLRCSDVRDAIYAFTTDHISDTTRVDVSTSHIGRGFYTDVQKLEMLVQYLFHSPLRGKKKIITIREDAGILRVIIESPEYETAKLYTDITLHKLARAADLLLDNIDGTLIIAAKTELCGAGVIYANSRNALKKILERVYAKQSEKT
jgi:hypothetical protein